MQRFGIEIELEYLIFLLSSTIFTYSIHRIIGMKKVEQFAHKGRFAVINRFKNHIITYAIASSIICTYTFIHFDLDRILLLFGAGVISILYALPVFGNSMRLRDFSYIKIFLIAIVWAFVTESIPLIEQANSLGIVLLLFLERMLFFLAITIPFDIRDLEVDRTNNVKTIPSVLGRNKAIGLSILLILIAAMIEIYLLGIDGIFVLTNISQVASIIAYSVIAIYIFAIRNKEDDYFYSGLLDGSIMLPYLLFIILISFS